MYILYNNKAKDSTITYSTQTTLYEAENIVTTNTKQGWRSTTDGASYVVFDLGSAMDVDCIGFKNHNLTSGATIKIQGNATDSWGSPSVDVTLTWRDCETIFEGFTGGSYRYWRFYVDDTGNADGYIEVGTLYIGEVFNMPGMSPTIEFVWNNNSYVEYSTSNQAFGDTRETWMGYNVEFPNPTNAQRKNIITMLNTVQNVTPIFVTIFDDDQDFEDPFFATITNQNVSFKKNSNVLFANSLLFRETD